MHPALSRRQFVQGAAAVASTAAWPLLAKGPGKAGGKASNLRQGEILPDPDFSQLRDKDPFLIGIRPYRTAGVRLERVLQPIPSPGGDKVLIHNYGHGGAGVTLSWGCASVVVDHVEEITTTLKAAKRVPSVAVLGTGIIGLTTATELRRRWPDLPITIYAMDLDLRSTVSWVAGGQFEPSGMHRLYKTKAQKAVLNDYMRRARARIVEIQNSGHRHDYGVAVRKNYTLDHKMPAFDTLPRDVIPRPRKGRLPFAKLNAPGKEYLTFLMNPSILMPKLIEDLAAAQVGREEAHFKTEKDLADLPQNIIVNCTGLGSKALFNDDAMVPQRGHNVILKKTDERQFYFFSGGCENWVISYLFCRQDDIVVGGTVQKGNDSLIRTPEDDKTFQRLIANGRELFGGRPAGCTR